MKKNEAALPLRIFRISAVSEIEGGRPQVWIARMHSYSSHSSLLLKMNWLMIPKKASSGK